MKTLKTITVNIEDVSINNNLSAARVKNVEKDTDFCDSIKLNGIIENPKVYYRTYTEEVPVLNEKGKKTKETQIITHENVLTAFDGHRRIQAGKLAGFTKIDVDVVEVTENDLRGLQYALNQAKRSTVAEMTKHIREDYNTMSKEALCNKYRLSRASVDKALKIDKLPEEILAIEGVSFKNLAFIASNKADVIINNKLVRKAMTGTIEELKHAVTKVKENLKNGGDGQVTEEEIKKIIPERKTQFFNQLESVYESGKTTIGIKKLLNWLYNAEVENWI